MTSLKRACGLLLVLALVLGLQAVAYAQTGAASITGLVTDQSGAAVPGVTVDGHQPGHERRLHRRHERDGQLRHPVGARRPVRRQGGALRVQDDVHPADHARGQADRPPRPEDGGRRARGHRRGDRPGARAPDRDGHRRRGALGQHRAVAAAQRPQRQPAGPPAARRDHAEPGLVHRRPELGRRRPALHQRQPRADEQLPDRRRRHERDGGQPDRLPAEPGCPRRDQRGDEQLLGRRRQRRRRGDQQRHQVRREPVPRERVRVLPQQRLRREHVGQQPLRARRRPSARSTSSAPPSAGRSSRTSCSSSWTTRARSSTSPGRRRPPSPRPPGAPAISRACSRAPSSGTPSPAALPEQPDPPEPDQPHRDRDPQQPGLPASQPRRDRGHRQLRERLPQHHSGPPGRPPARLERVGQRQALPPLLDRGAHDQDGEDGVRAPPRRPDRGPLPQPGAQLEPRLQLLADQRGPGRVQLDQQHHGAERLGRHRQRQRDLRDPRRPADRGPERDQLGQRPHEHRLRGHHRGQPAEGLPAQREADLDQG